jgi:hypothetical protein
MKIEALEMSSGAFSAAQLSRRDARVVRSVDGLGHDYAA